MVVLGGGLHVLGVSVFWSGFLVLWHPYVGGVRNSVVAWGAGWWG